MKKEHVPVILIVIGIIIILFLAYKAYNNINENKTLIGGKKPAPMVDTVKGSLSPENQKLFDNVFPQEIDNFKNGTYYQGLTNVEQSNIDTFINQIQNNPQMQKDIFILANKQLLALEDAIKEYILENTN